MKAFLLCYSGTGNTRLVAKTVARAMDQNGVSVELLDYKEWNHADLDSADLIGIAYPVYFWKPPLPVLWWLDGNLPDGSGRAAFVICTYAGVLSRGLQMGCERVLAKGYKLLAADAFLGEEAYPRLRFSFYIASKGRPGAEELQRAEHLGGRVAALYEKWKKDAASVPDAKFPTDSGVFKVIGDLTATPRSMRFWLGKKRVDREKCNGCGLCEKRCPVGSVRLDGSYPVFDESRCIGCGTCYNICPKDAVLLRFDWGSRYRGPKAGDAVT